MRKVSGYKTIERTVYTKAVLTLSVFCILFAAFSLSGCSGKKTADFKTLYTEYLGKSEEEFLKDFPEAESWEKESGTLTDEDKTEHQYTFYSSENGGVLAGFPAEIELQFTEGYGLTTIYLYAAPTEKVSRSDYYNKLLSIYDETEALLGAPDTAGESADDPSFWFNETDEDAFFEKLNEKADKQSGTDRTVYWNIYEEDTLKTTAMVSGLCVIPFEDENLVSFTQKVKNVIEQKGLF